MRIYVDARNITELGMKVFVDGTITSEVMFKGVCGITFFDITSGIQNSITFELTDVSCLMHPVRPQMVKIGSPEAKAIPIEPYDQHGEGRKIAGFVYPYRTVLTGIDCTINELYCNFTPLGDLAVIGLTVKKWRRQGIIENCICEQFLERIPTDAEIKRRRIRYVFTFAAALLLFIAAVLVTLIYVLAIEVSNQFEARSNFSLAFICVAPFALIPYAIYFRSRGAFEVLVKCKKVRANEIKEKFKSQYYEKQITGTK